MSHTPDANPIPSKGQAGADPYAIPLAQIDVSDAELFETDTHWGYFARLRKEDPVHHCAASDFGPYWSVTRYDDIVQVEKNPEIYSSARSIVVGDPDPSFPLEAGFITMDGARHQAHRKVVQPVTSPRNLGCARAADPPARARDPGRSPGRARASIGSIASPSSSPPACWPRSSTFRTSSAVSSRTGRTWRRRVPAMVGSGDATEEQRRAVLHGLPRGVHGPLEAAREPAADRASRLHHGARERLRDAWHGARWSTSGP